MYTIDNNGMDRDRDNTMRRCTCQYLCKIKGGQLALGKQNRNHLKSESQLLPVSVALIYTVSCASEIVICCTSIMPQHAAYTFQGEEIGYNTEKEEEKRVNSLRGWLVG